MTTTTRPADIMPPALFEEVGQALYGDSWKAAVAHDLDTQPSRVSQILKGERHARGGYARRLLASIDERRQHLDAAEQKLRAWIDEVGA